MAVELLDTQYTRRPVAAFTNPGKDCTFWARTESVMFVKPTVEVQNCTYWYLPPFVALFQPAAKSQPRGLYAQHGLLEQVPVPGMGQEGAAQQADDELAIAAPTSRKCRRPCSSRQSPAAPRRARTTPPRAEG